VAAARSQAASRTRPLERRDLSTDRPARVRMRTRKPWVLARLRLLGWKVRFTSRLQVRGSRLPGDLTAREHRPDQQGRPGYVSSNRPVKRARCRRELRPRPCGQPLPTQQRRGSVAPRSSGHLHPSPGCGQKCGQGEEREMNSRLSGLVSA
jgi:hypothetical protein